MGKTNKMEARLSMEEAAENHVAISGSTSFSGLASNQISML
jgi:hypothetical protein